MLNLIYLAAGSSSRFGSNKLLHPVAGRSMYRHGLDRLRQVQQRRDGDCRVVVVTAHEEIRRQLEAEFSEPNSQPAVLAWNDESWKGISSSIQCGILAVEKASAAEIEEIEWGRCRADQGAETAEVGIAAEGQRDWFLFLVADQPCLTQRTLEAFLFTFFCSGKELGCLCWKNSRGNPAIFSSFFLNELKELHGDAGGKQLVNRHEEQCFFYQADSKAELEDVDYLEDFERIYLK